MARDIRTNVKTLAQAEQSIREGFQNSRACLIKQLEELDARMQSKLDRAAEVRRVAALIEGAGIPLTLYSWDDMTDLNIDLGENITRTDRKRVVTQLAALRGILGRRNKEYGRPLHSAKRRTVHVQYSYADHPHIRVSWVERLPKDARCKIERRRGGSYSTLVCTV